MKPVESQEPSSEFAALLDRGVVRARIVLVMSMGGSLLVILAAVMVIVAGLDLWLKPEHFWFGGSIVWLVLLLSGWFQGVSLGLPSAWPTRLSVARKWEQRWPQLGSQVSSAVSFLDIPKEVPQRSPGHALKATSSDFRSLAVEIARHAVSNLPVTSYPRGGQAFWTFIGGGACLMAVVGSGQWTSTNWQRALTRQVPPAVGGWTALPAEPLVLERQAVRITPGELSSLIRNLVTRFADIKSAVEQGRMTLTEGVGKVQLQSCVEDIRLLRKDLLPSMPARLVHRFGQILIHVELADDPLPVVAHVVTLGQAAVSLADAAAVEQRLSRQLVRLLQKYPGIQRIDLPVRVVSQLDCLAESQQIIFAVTNKALDALAELCPDRGLPDRGLSVPEFQQGLSQLISLNRLALAATASSRAADHLAVAAAELGLVVPAKLSWQAGAEGVNLAAVVATVAGVEAELDAVSETVAAASDPKTSLLAVSPGSEISKNDSAQRVLLEATQQSGSGHAAGRSSQSSGQLQGEMFEPQISRKGWRLLVPEERASGRMAVDETLPPELVVKFGEYLQLVAPAESLQAVHRTQP